MTFYTNRIASTLAGGILFVGLCCLPASAAGLGIGASVGGSGGAKAGVGVGVGGSQGVSAGVGASLGGSRGANAGLGANIGGGSGVSAGLGASVGGKSGVNAGVGANIGGTGAQVGVGIDAGTTSPGTPGAPSNPANPSAPSMSDVVTGMSAKQLARYRIRCQEVLKGQASYDRSLRELCMMIQTASR